MTPSPPSLQALLLDLLEATQAVGRLLSEGRLDALAEACRRREGLVRSLVALAAGASVAEPAGPVADEVRRLCEAVLAADRENLAALRRLRDETGRRLQELAAARRALRSGPFSAGPSSGWSARG